MMENHPPAISVVVPAYNSGRFIDEALASALAQTGPTLEIIVVDDGSSDDTVDRVRSYGDRVRLIQQANQGSAVARNLGIHAARADYVAFLDADDYWHPGKLERQWARVQAGAPLVYAAFSLWEPDAAGVFPDAAAHLASCQGRGNRPALSGWLYIDLLLDCKVWTSTVLARKDLLLKVGGFDPQLRKGQDFDLWLKLAHEAPWEGVSESLALYRLHTENITRTVNATNFEYRILDGAYRRWGLHNPDGRQLPKAVMQQRLARSARNFADAHLSSGSRETASNYYRIALAHQPLAPRVWLNYLRARWLPR